MRQKIHESRPSYKANHASRAWVQDHAARGTRLICVYSRVTYQAFAGLFIVGVGWRHSLELNHASRAWIQDHVSLLGTFTRLVLNCGRLSNWFYVTFCHQISSLQSDAFGRTSGIKLYVTKKVVFAQPHNRIRASHLGSKWKSYEVGKNK